MTHVLSPDAIDAKRRATARVWLRQLASLVGDHGFREISSCMDGGRTTITLCDAEGRALVLATAGVGRFWYATDAATGAKTGGRIRKGGTPCLERAYRRTFERVIRPR